MSAEACIRSILTNDANVSALVGDRVYAYTAPPRVTQPFVTFFRVSMQHGFNFTTGPERLSNRLYQIDCWAPTYDGMRALADAVSAALNGNRSGNGLQGIFVQNRVESYQEDVHCYHEAVEAAVWYEEG